MTKLETIDADGLAVLLALATQLHLATPAPQWEKNGSLMEQMVLWPWQASKLKHSHTASSLSLHVLCGHSMGKTGRKIKLNAHFLCRLVLDITGTGSRQDGTKTSFPWADSVQVNNVFGAGTGGPYGLGMLWKIEGFFMINNYHMAVINDNDFGLEQV